jgi:hypothetical protein
VDARIGGGSSASDDQGDAPIAARSFVVRALLEDDAQGVRSWHGFVTETGTGRRQLWQRSSDIARFIEQRLPRTGAPLGLHGADMAGPQLTDVITAMLTDLGGSRLVAVAALPDPNVTLERVAERLVGLGNQRGGEPAGPIGERVLRGGRLDARVRFQLWGATATGVDESVLTLQSDLLDDREDLRRVGFLKLSAVDTSVAEQVDSVGGWRKTTSYDVLYEYQYVDTDETDSLIARIPVSTATGMVSETQVLTDEMVRWDDEKAPDLILTGPLTIDRFSALVFVPAALTGTITTTRSSGGGNAPTHFADLPAFVAATGGPDPAETDADVELTPNDFFTALGPGTTTLDMGDWNADGAVDEYTSHELVLPTPIVLPTWRDRLAITYVPQVPPPGPTSGLDQTAVVYLRVNAGERQT